jgi:hypothetical protein
MIRAHFKLSLVIGDTEGHDKVCTHYCSYSSNLQRVSRDCDLPQSKCDDPDAACDMVEMEQIKAIVKEQIDVLNAVPKRNIGVARDNSGRFLKFPSCLPFLISIIVVTHMVSLEVVRSSGYMHGCPGL